MYKGTSIRLTDDFVPEIMGAKKQWDNIFEVFEREPKLSTKNFVSLKLFLENEGDINTCPEKPTKKEFIISLHCRNSKEIFFQVKEKGQQKATQIHMKKITDYYRNIKGNINIFYLQLFYYLL